jgi:four helix bundle protein
MYHSFEDLEVWKRACRLAVSIYKTLENCPDYGLKSQMERSAVSIASNIAEGAERGQKDFCRFLRIARGSSAELRTQLYIASKIGIVERQTASEFVSELKQISKMLTGLAKSLVVETKTRRTN